MYTVYGIKSQKDGRIYVGMTSNLPNRINEHNAGGTRSTRSYVPWFLIYQQNVENRIEARVLEKKLKSGYGKEFLKNLSPSSSVG